MEELKKLEQVQRTLGFMESRGMATSSDLESNRFLANLIVLLVISATLLPTSIITYTGHLDMDLSLVKFYRRNFFLNSFRGNNFELIISQIFLTTDMVLFFEK